MAYDPSVWTTMQSGAFQDSAFQDIELEVTRPQAAFLASDAQYTLFQGGYGAAKSVGLGFRIVQRAGQNPGLAGMLVADSYQRIERDAIPPLFDILERMEIEHEWVRSKIRGLPSRCLMIDPGGMEFRLYIGSADSPRSLKGPNLAAVFIEECTTMPRFVQGLPEPVWNVLVSRLRMINATNTIDASGTPEGIGNWTNDAGRWGRCPDDPKKFGPWSREYRRIIAPTWTNPWLAPDYVERLLNTLDEVQIDEKVRGIARAGVGGRMYYEFDMQRHVGDVRFDRWRGPIIIGQDYNVNPATAVLMQFWGGRFWIFDEVSLRHSNTEAVAGVIKRKLRELNEAHGTTIRPQDCVVHPDATGRSMRSNANKSDHDIMRSHGFPLKFAPSGNPRRLARMHAVNGVMYHDRVIAARKCVGLIRDWVNVAIGDDGEPMEGPQGDLTHLGDSAGYPIAMLMPAGSILARAA